MKFLKIYFKGPNYFKIEFEKMMNSIFGKTVTVANDRTLGQSKINRSKWR
jgi:hypothetical protein